MDPPSAAPPKDFTEVKLKDGTRLRLKGGNLGPEDVAAGVAKFRTHIAGTSAPSTPTPEQQQSLDRSAQPTQFEKDRTPQGSSLGRFTSAALQDVGGAAHSMANAVLHPIPTTAALGFPTAQEKQKVRAQSDSEKAAGYGPLYRGLARIGIVNAPAMESAAAHGDTAGVAGHVALPLAAAVAPLAAEGAARIAPKIGEMAGDLGDAISDKTQGLAEKIAGPLVQKPKGAVKADIKFGRNLAGSITKEPGLAGLTKEKFSDSVSQRLNELGGVIDDTLSTPQALAKGKVEIGPIIDESEQDALKSPSAKLNKGLRSRISEVADNLRTEWGDTSKTPLEAARMKRDIGRATKWTGQPFDNEVNQFQADVYRGINDGVNKMVPEVAPLNNRYGSLLSAKYAIDDQIASELNKPGSISKYVMGAKGLGATAVGGLTGGLPGAAAGAAVDLARTTPGRLLASRALSRLAGTQYDMPMAPEPIEASAAAAPVAGVPLEPPTESMLATQPGPDAQAIAALQQKHGIGPELATKIYQAQQAQQVSQEPPAAIATGTPTEAEREAPGEVQSQGVPTEPLTGNQSDIGPNVTNLSDEQNRAMLEKAGFNLDDEFPTEAYPGDNAMPDAPQSPVRETTQARPSTAPAPPQRPAPEKEDRSLFAVPEQGDLSDLHKEIKSKIESGKQITTQEVENLHAMADKAEEALRGTTPEAALESQIAKGQRRVDYLKSKIRTSRSRTWGEIMPQLKEAQEALDKLRGSKKAPTEEVKGGD
jgi:hypothetical protein